MLSTADHDPLLPRHMLRRLSTGALVLLCLLAWRDSQAQDVSAGARAFIRPHLQSKLVVGDTLLEFRTRPVTNGRIDVDEGVLRAAYNVRHRVTTGLTPAAAALRHIEESPSYGIGRPSENLTVSEIRRGKNSSHITLQQTLSGIPVYRREVKVNLDASGQPTLVINSYAPHLDGIAGFDPIPRITVREAVAQISAAAVGRMQTSEPILVVYPSKPPKLAWNMKAWPIEGSAEFEVLIDAVSGEIIEMMDITLHAHGGVRDVAHEERTATVSPPAMAAVDGSGLVFDPDPLTTAGVEYGPPYVDNDDADIPELNAQRVEVVLRDITLGTDGFYRLEGPYVRIDGTSCGITYIPPAERSPDAFRYTRSNHFFEAVNVYYHIDKSQRYVQSLDVGFPIREYAVSANPRGLGGEDDSNYANNCIRFGTGGIDDAEDADVIWHEYAHALLDDIVPNLYTPRTSDGAAFHEGWGDYWAASYSRYFAEEGGFPHNWRKVFTWDGNTSFPGRTLDHSGHYPDDWEYPQVGSYKPSKLYALGMLWATTLMEIYDHVGRSVMDRLNLASHAYISRTSEFPDFAQALIQADQDLYGGLHSGVIIDRLGARGYIDPANYGPALVHQPLPATEEVGGNVPIEVTAIGASSAVENVHVVYGSGAELTHRLDLVLAGGNTYTGDLPLPAEPGTIRYYIEAEDAEGRFARLPAGAPATTFSFDVGPDGTLPNIEHEPPLLVPLAGWPIDIYAEVSDAFGVDSVWIEYVIDDPAGSVQEEGIFGMEIDEGIFRGRFPTAAHKIIEGGAVNYRIRARDASAAGNVAALPAEGMFHIQIVEQGVLRAFDFEGANQGVTGGGIWQLGRPTYGLGVAHSGRNVWATGPATEYPDIPQLSSLELPSVDLSAIDQSYLVFWHWYDFEHDGLVEPGTFNGEAGIWDGGNVKVSSDGGQTWNVLEPQGNYNGIVSASHGNPLGGQPAFGGYSYGWRQEILPLPRAADVRIRFDFGTDDSNQDHSLQFAGWYVDDVSITKELSRDVEAPTAKGLPDAREVRAPGAQVLSQLSIEVRDDTGLEAVLSEYEVTNDGGRVSGTRRLVMSTINLSIYSGAVAPAQEYVAGDRIEYRIILRDFAGNESVYPATGSFVIDFRTKQESNALADVTPSGVWRRQGSAWAAAGEAAGPISSMVFEPFMLPHNSETATLKLRHAYDLGDGVGGNVKVTSDDGKHWSVLSPVGGYPSTMGGTHSMSGEGIFSGTSGGAGEVLFDLSALAGTEIRIRIDLGHGRALEAGESWSVQQAAFVASTPDSVLDTPLELSLNANFPDPFAYQTTISYSIPESMPVRLAVFDMLGRRAALILHEVQDEGTYTVTFDGSGLASGVYMLHLETTKGTRTERMIVAR